MHERDDEINAVATGLASAVGTDPEEMSVFGYHRRTNPGCQNNLGIEELGDAWYERNSFSVFPDEHLTVVFAHAVEYLENEGFSVDELVAEKSGGRGIHAIRNDLGINIDFGPGPDGGANFTITAGPCGAELTPIRDVYKVVSE